MQANILQPLTHVGTLSLRYDAVEELLASEELLVDVVQGLQALPRDLDRVCRGLVRTLHAPAATWNSISFVWLPKRHALEVLRCTHTIAAPETFFGV